MYPASSYGAGMHDGPDLFDWITTCKTQIFNPINRQTNSHNGANVWRIIRRDYTLPSRSSLLSLLSIPSLQNRISLHRANRHLQRTRQPSRIARPGDTDSEHCCKVVG